MKDKVDIFFKRESRYIIIKLNKIKMRNPENVFDYMLILSQC